MQLDYLSQIIGDTGAKTHHDRLISSNHSNKTPVDNNALQQREALFSNKLKPQQARDFLVSRVLKKIDATSPANINAQNKNYTNNASPRDTANNIIASLNKLSQKSMNTEMPSISINRLSDILHSAIEETRNTLDKVNALTPEITSEFESIFNEVTNFIDSLGNRSNESVSSNFYQYQSNTQINIQIETADGDVVTLDIAKSLAIENSSMAYSNRESSGQVSSSYMEKNSRLNYTVVGNLDENEINSINKLIEKISKTTSQYEKGNVDSALKLAQNLKLDGDTLKAFEFKIQTSEQYRAIDLYERTKNIDTLPDTSLQGNIASSSAFDNIKNILSLATHDIAMKDPISKIREIFDRFYEQQDLSFAERAQQQETYPKFTLDDVA